MDAAAGRCRARTLSKAHHPPRSRARGARAARRRRPAPRRTGRPQARADTSRHGASQGSAREVRRKERRVNPDKRRRIFERLREANPSPKTELVYRSPFQLLIAVLLSAQATDKSVNLATRALFRDAGTPQAMLALGEAGLTPYVRTIGLFRTKARNIIATCRLLIEQHKGRVPR